MSNGGRFVSDTGADKSIINKNELGRKIKESKLPTAVVKNDN